MPVVKNDEAQEIPMVRDELSHDLRGGRGCSGGSLVVDRHLARRITHFDDKL